DGRTGLQCGAISRSVAPCLGCLGRAITTHMAPEPRANPLLLGHEVAETTLLEAMRSGRMHHAWLITGPDGVGKATLAYRFARRLLAGTPADDTLAMEPAHPVFRRVAAGAH